MLDFFVPLLIELYKVFICVVPDIRKPEVYAFHLLKLFQNDLQNEKPRILFDGMYTLKKYL